jgi:hypothetical protein
VNQICEDGKAGLSISNDQFSITNNQDTSAIKPLTPGRTLDFDKMDFDKLINPENVEQVKLSSERWSSQSDVIIGEQATLRHHRQQWTLQLTYRKMMPNENIR